jgi:hypothetical protein
VDANPFEPPQADDHANLTDAGPREVSDDALRALAESAPWARWTARLLAASLVMAVVQAVVSLPYYESVAVHLTALLVGAPIGILYLVFVRRYAAHAEAVARNEHAGVEGAIAAQGGLFTAAGVVAILGSSLFVLGLLLAVVALRRS